jgi:hypothetical protein
MPDLGPIGTKKDSSQVSHAFHDGNSVGPMTLADYETTAGMSVNGLVNVRNWVRRDNYVTIYYRSRCFILFYLGDKGNMSETRIHSTCLEFINHSWASKRKIKEEDNQAIHGN